MYHYPVAVMGGSPMKWNQFLGGILIGLGLGLFLGGAIVESTGKWNSTSSAGGSMLLVMTGTLAAKGMPQKKAPQKAGPEQFSQES
jgi:hypothetical protein